MSFDLWRKGRARGLLSKVDLEPEMAQHTKHIIHIRACCTSHKLWQQTGMAAAGAHVPSYRMFWETLNNVGQGQDLTTLGEPVTLLMMG